MTRRATSSVEAVKALAHAFEDSLVTLGASATLATILAAGTPSLTAADLSRADYLFIEPHASDAWIRFTGRTAAVDAGHKIEAGVNAEIEGHTDLATLTVFGSGAATISLFEYSTNI
jgi:hypothetical protein